MHSHLLMILHAHFIWATINIRLTLFIKTGQADLDFFLDRVNPFMFVGFFFCLFFSLIECSRRASMS